ncbi:MAG: hypothetical protein ACKVOR_01585 [Flavobacteriales bacterium]
MVKKRFAYANAHGSKDPFSEVTYFYYVYGNNYSKIERAIKQYIDTTTIDLTMNECEMIFYKSDEMPEASEIRMDWEQFNDYISMCPEDDNDRWSKAYCVYSIEPNAIPMKDREILIGSIFFLKQSPKYQQELIHNKLPKDSSHLAN